MVIGVLGPVVGFLITGSYDRVNGVIWLATGLVAFAPAAVALPRRAEGQKSG